MVACGCYQMVTVATDEGVMLPKIVATEGHISDRRFGDITDETLEMGHKMSVAKVGLSIATEAFCSSVSRS
jgi:hypothetical protein